MGACLCESGFKPKDGKTDQDDVSDCEADVKPSCSETQSVTITGSCANSDEDLCFSQCNNQTGGKIVQGTGVCTCPTIVDPN